MQGLIIKLLLFHKTQSLGQCVLEALLDSVIEVGGGGQLILGEKEDNTESKLP